MEASRNSERFKKVNEEVNAVHLRDMHHRLPAVTPSAPDWTSTNLCHAIIYALSTITIDYTRDECSEVYVSDFLAACSSRTCWQLMPQRKEPKSRSSYHGTSVGVLNNDLVPNCGHVMYSYANELGWAPRSGEGSVT